MKNIYLIGNPNVGKTTLFNALTHNNAETGNYAGTTLEIKKATIQEYTIIDLPGMYGGKKPSEEEKVAWKAIENAMTDENAVFVQVVNPIHWEQSLVLALELKKKGIPLVLFINYKKTPPTNAFIQSIQEHLCIGVCSGNAHKKNIHHWFFQKIEAAQKEKKSQVCTLNEFQLISNIKKDSSILSASEKNWDFLILHPIFGIGIFAFLMGILFQLVFTLGSIPLDAIDAGFAWAIENGKEIFGTSLWSLLFFDGLVGGVGATLVFLPNIILLFFALSLLKESGYLARSSYLLNTCCKSIGLSGRISVPLLMGFGCNVPSVMAISTLESRKEKIAVAMMSLFMSCGARLPVYTLLIGAFIPQVWQGITLFSIYLFGILVAFGTGSMINKIYPELTTGLRLQLPSYQFPSLAKAVSFAMFQAKDFFERVWKFIIPASIILWGLFTFPLASVETQGIEGSYGASISKTIQPLFAPLGFDWTITAGVLAGVSAKEVMVANFSQIYGQEDLNEFIKTLPQFSLPTVLALLVFTLLYMPCIAVIATIKAQLGTNWAIVGAIYPSVIAWIFAYITFSIASFFL